MNDDNIVIKKIDLDDVLTFGKQKYNVNNLLPAENYSDTLKSVQTKNWITPFIDYELVQIKDKSDLTWIKEAAHIGSISGTFPVLHNDELESLCNRYQVYNELLHKGVFVRTDHVSLKTGIHGKGPYTSIKQIIESICTSTPGHKAVEQYDTTINLYIIPWLELETDYEFRLFVYNNKLTGISVQHIYKRNEKLNNKTDDDIKNLVQRIIDYFYNNFLKKWSLTKSKNMIENYTIDIAFLNINLIYFIEVNPFGAEHAAGSSLFHWIYDKDILCGNGDIVEFRYV